MHPCQAGYPCVYLSIADPLHAKCMLAECHLKHVTIPPDETEHAYDKLTGELLPWVTRKLPKQSTPDAVLIERQTEYKRMMEEANTYERRRGAVRQKRHA